MKIHVELGENSYDITLEHGLISRITGLIDTKRRVLIVTDEGVPSKYAEQVALQCSYPEIAVIPQGEESKTLDTYSLLLKKMLDCGFNREDCVIAVGGGVVGDLSGFAAHAICAVWIFTIFRQLCFLRLIHLSEAKRLLISEESKMLSAFSVSPKRF